MVNVSSMIKMIVYWMDIMRQMMKWLFNNALKSALRRDFDTLALNGHANVIAEMNLIKDLNGHGLINVMIHAPATPIKYVVEAGLWGRVFQMIWIKHSQDDAILGWKRWRSYWKPSFSVYTTLTKEVDGQCIYDFPLNRRVLDEFSITGLTNLTILSCANFCIEYEFFGVQGGNECYCGNDDSKFLPTPIPGECNMPCAGDQRQVRLC